MAGQGQLRPRRRLRPRPGRQPAQGHRRRQGHHLRLQGFLGAHSYSVGGTPYLAPELVLLFKAKHPRPKDQEDFGSILPHRQLSAQSWGSVSGQADHVRSAA
ncbi:hypothetical protein DCW30_02870 [Streptomyces alfalfae]|nr:hypothetical protein DCW30_02870 [Streptomyces alfalfae]RZM99171.1 hypothetical protein D4104_10955 [Streptomyces alfalfae]